MSTTFGRIGGALAKAQELAGQHDAQAAERQQREAMQKLQMDAILSGLQAKQDAATTQQTTLARRVAVLKRNPKLAGYDDESLAGIAMDEPTFSKVIGESLLTPKMDRTPVLVDGKPTLARKDEHGNLTDDAGNPITNAQPIQSGQRTTGPVRGTPEFLKAREDELKLEAKYRSGGGADDKVLVQVQQPDGTVVYLPRAQAAGKQAPRAQAGAGGADRQKKIQALANASDALDSFERTLATTGSTIQPGAAKDALQTDYENLQLQMKEMYNLGVLNGPDLALMRRVVGDPTSLTGRAMALGRGDEQTTRIQAQIVQLRQKLEGFKRRLAEGNAALGVPMSSDSDGNTITVNGKTFKVPD